MYVIIIFFLYTVNAYNDLYDLLLNNRILQINGATF